MMPVDPALVAHFRAHPAAMRAFDDLAARRGQSIEAALGAAVPPALGIPADDVLVRYIDAGAPCAVIHADGTVTDLEEDA
jgi:hypothetical protein